MDRAKKRIDVRHDSAVAARLASLRFVLFDRASDIPGPATHALLLVVANEIEGARA